MSGLLLTDVTLRAGRQCLERAGLPVDHHTVVKQLGIEKQSTFAVSDSEVEQVVAAVKQDLALAAH